MGKILEVSELGAVVPAPKREPQETRAAGSGLCHRRTIENPSVTDHDQAMKCAAPLSLAFALGFLPLLGHGDSRNMAAQIDSEESGGERTLYRVSGGARRPTQQPVAPLPGVEFEFTRLVYEENPNYARGWGWGGRRWMTDAPEAETHLLQGIRRLTRVNAASEGTAIALDDDALFDHPFLYAVEVGGWLLSDQEAARLREYLDRGGFLMVDDFHGSIQWEGFMESMRKVYPDRPVVELPVTDEVFHVLYDLVDRPQIPSIYGAMTGRTWEQDGFTPHWRGIHDEDGRLTVAINFNMDLGDAWEHADAPEYPQPLTALAYRYAINYLLYSMSH